MVGNAEKMICLRCGRVFSVLTGEHLGEQVYDEHARDKLICSPCKAELDKETWDARG